MRSFYLAEDSKWWKLNHWETWSEPQRCFSPVGVNLTIPHQILSIWYRHTMLKTYNTHIGTTQRWNMQRSAAHVFPPTCTYKPSYCRSPSQLVSYIPSTHLFLMASINIETDSNRIPAGSISQCFYWKQFLYVFIDHLASLAVFGLFVTTSWRWL